LTYDLQVKASVHHAEQPATVVQPKLKAKKDRKTLARTLGNIGGWLSKMATSSTSDANIRHGAVKYVDDFLSSARLQKNASAKICFGNKLLWPECLISSEENGKFQVKFDHVNANFVNGASKFAFEEWANLGKKASQQPFHAVAGGILVQEQQFKITDESGIQPSLEENQVMTGRLIPRGSSVSVSKLIQVGETVELCDGCERDGKLAVIKKLQYVDEDLQVGDIVKVVRGKYRGDRGIVRSCEGKKSMIEFVLYAEACENKILTKEQYDYVLESEHKATKGFGEEFKTTKGCNGVKKIGKAAKYAGKVGLMGQVCNRLNKLYKYEVTLISGEKEMFGGETLELREKHEFLFEFKSPTAPDELVVIHTEVPRPKRKIANPSFSLKRTISTVSPQSVVAQPVVFTAPLGFGKSTFCTQYAHSVASRSIDFLKQPLKLGTCVKVTKGSLRIGRTGTISKDKDVDGDYHVQFDTDWEVLNEDNIVPTHYHHNEILVQVPLVIEVDDLDTTINEHPSEITADDDILKIHLERHFPDLASALLNARRCGMLLVILDGIDCIDDQNQQLFENYVRNRLLTEVRLCITAREGYLEKSDPFSSFFVHLKSQSLTEKQQSKLVKSRLELAPAIDVPMQDRVDALTKRLKEFATKAKYMTETPLLLNMLIHEYIKAEVAWGDSHNPSSMTAAVKSDAYGLFSWTTLHRTVVYQSATDAIILQGVHQGLAQQGLPKGLTVERINTFFQYVSFVLFTEEYETSFRTFDDDFLKKIIFKEKPELQATWALIEPLIEARIFPIISVSGGFTIANLRFQENMAAKYVVKQLTEAEYDKKEETISDFVKLFSPDSADAQDSETYKRSFEKFLQVEKYQRIVQMVLEMLLEQTEGALRERKDIALSFAREFLAPSFPDEEGHHHSEDEMSDDDEEARHLVMETIHVAGGLDSYDAGRTFGTLLASLVDHKLKLQLAKSEMKASAILGLNHAIEEWPHVGAMITDFDISDNKLNGHFPLEMYEMLFWQNTYNLKGNKFDVDYEFLNGSAWRTLQSVIMHDYHHIRDIAELNLRQRYLTGSVPNFGFCTQLTDLFLESNDLRGELFSFSGCKSLEVLWLQDNKLTGPLPSFNENENLRSLRVENNHGMTGEIPSFSNCFHLRTLKMNSNQFGGKIPDFSKNQYLEEMDISFNQFEGELPSFERCTGLVRLDVSGNQLEGAIPSFANCSMLKFLEMANNLFIGKVPDFSSCTALTILDLGFNDLDGDVPNLVDCEGLEALFLNDNDRLKAESGRAATDLMPKRIMARKNTMTDLTFTKVQQTEPYHRRKANPIWLHGKEWTWKGGQEISPDF